MSRYNEGVPSIECAPSLYLDIVLFWPDDGFLQPKYFAKILKYFHFAHIYTYVVFLAGIKIYYNIRSYYSNRTQTVTVAVAYCALH